VITPQIVDDDITASYYRLVAAIIGAAEVNIPVRTPASKPRPKTVPYWTDECTEAVKKRNQAKNKMQKTKDLTDRQNYYRLRGAAQHKIKAAQKQYCSFFYRVHGKIWPNLPTRGFASITP